MVAGLGLGSHVTLNAKYQDETQVEIVVAGESIGFAGKVSLAPSAAMSNASYVQTVAIDSPANEERDPHPRFPIDSLCEYVSSFSDSVSKIEISGWAITANQLHLFLHVQTSSDFHQQLDFGECCRVLSCVKPSQAPPPLWRQNPLGFRQYINFD